MAKNKQMSVWEFQQWLDYRKWGPANVANLMRVDPRTVRRWLSGKQDIPYLAQAFVVLYDPNKIPFDEAPESNPRTKYLVFEPDQNRA